MIMRTPTILLLAVLTSGLGQAQKPMPEMQTIGQGKVSRISDNKGASGNDIPPWKEVRVIQIFDFKRKPVIGAKVTVVPIGVDIPALNLRIIKAELTENACDESLPAWWDVELEPINVKKFFEVQPTNRLADYPFDVAVIYPAVTGARQIKNSQLAKSTLPKGVFINTVKTALDVTGDGKPDALIVEYCCLHPKRSPNDNCELTCGKTFKRVGTTWRLVDSFKPC